MQKLRDLILSSVLKRFHGYFIKVCEKTSEIYFNLKQKKKIDSLDTLLEC